MYWARRTGVVRLQCDMNGNVYAGEVIYNSRQVIPSWAYGIYRYEYREDTEPGREICQVTAKNYLNQENYRYNRRDYPHYDPITPQVPEPYAIRNSVL